MTRRAKNISKTIKSIRSLPKGVRIRGNAKSIVRIAVGGGGFGRAIYNEGGFFGPRRQSGYQLVVILEGEASVTVDKCIHHLLAGEAILMHPGHTETYRFGANHRCVHLWCEVDLERLSVTDRRIIKSCSGVYRFPTSIIFLINEGLLHPEPHNPRFTNSLAALAKACLIVFSTHALRVSTVVKSEHPALMKALDQIGCTSSPMPSVYELARRSGVSYSRLRQVFRESGRDSPASILRKMKLDRAVKLITSTGLTLGEIANQTGFENPFHLSRLVKKTIGFSPRQIRQRAWLS